MKKLYLLALAFSYAISASAQFGNDVYSECDTVYQALGYKHGADGWRFCDIVNWSSKDSIWSWGPNLHNYLTGTTYLGGPHAGLGYALSPVIDLSDLTEAYVSFNHSAKYQQTLRELCSLCLWEEGCTVETALEIPVWPEAYNWNWCNSGYIDLSEFCGKKVQLGFRYESTKTSSDEWQVNNVVVTTSVPQLNPHIIYFGLPADSWVGYRQWESIDVYKPENISTVWGNYDSFKFYTYARGSAYLSGPGAALAYFRSPEIDLTDVESCSVSFDHAAKYQTSLRTLCRACVWLDDKLDEPILLDIPVWPEAGTWMFVNSGKIDLTPYAGHKIRFGFRYESTDTEADTWEVHNVVVRKEGSSAIQQIENASPKASRQVYTLNGMKGDTDLPGYYIVRDGEAVTKQLIR